MRQVAHAEVVPVGANGTTIWGMSAHERLRRLATKARLPFRPAAHLQSELLVNLAYVFDPLLLRLAAEESGVVLLDQQRTPVMAHLDASQIALRSRIVAAMEARAPLPRGLDLREIVHDDQFTLYNHQLRKRERPFLMPLTPETRPAVERASYYAAYKGVTDILTKYVWPEAALVLTRLAARIGATPNMVTALGAALCVLATYLFWQGQYWIGLFAGLAFMVLDTVDGKLARCTITSSKWGNIFDHGIDLIHPPFWWWAWSAGLSAWGLAFTSDEFTLLMGLIIGGYVVQRLIEGIFMRSFGMHIHVWERIDSQFRLVTARRNPNMVLLLGALMFGRPDIGLKLVAGWTLLSCVFHAVRLGQAVARRRGGSEIRSWIG